MEEFVMKNSKNEQDEAKARADMWKEENYTNKVMAASAAARYLEQKEEYLQTAEDAITRCRQYKADFVDLLLATAEPEPEPEQEVLANNSTVKFVNVKRSANRPARRKGSTLTRFKFAPPQKMNL